MAAIAAVVWAILSAPWKWVWGLLHLPGRMKAMEEASRNQESVAAAVQLEQERRATIEAEANLEKEQRETREMELRQQAAGEKAEREAQLDSNVQVRDGAVFRWGILPGRGLDTEQPYCQGCWRPLDEETLVPMYKVGQPMPESASGRQVQRWACSRCNHQARIPV